MMHIVPVMLFVLTVGMLMPVKATFNSVTVVSYNKLMKTQNGDVLCALDTANETTSSSSLEYCSLRCANDANCTGFNIKNSLTCDLYNYRPKINTILSACMFYQKISNDDEAIDCLQYGNDATSIPSQCCAYPYTLNGELYYNCTVNPAFSNDFGCYNDNGQWVTYYVAEYEETSSTVVSANPAFAVPLLTINAWILMQRRVTGGSALFNKYWVEYRDGFGSAAGIDNSYWLGLDKVYRLMQMGSVRLRVEIQRTSGLWYSAEYSTFSISDEVGKYQLTVTGYSGDAGDAMAAAPNHNSQGMMFSTPDSDNDASGSKSCASNNKCGWWFRACSASCINRASLGIWSAGAVVWDVQASHMLVKLN